MPDPILINRYASRRLYNTQSSEYVTLEEVAALIREGNDVEIKDRKTGEDLTRQYLLQIITEQESKGENVMPVNVLTGLVRSYRSSAQSILPEFLSKSYEAFSEQQESMMRSIASNLPDGLPQKIPFVGAGDWQKKQAEIYQSMMQAFLPGKPSAAKEPELEEPEDEAAAEPGEVAEIKEQLAALQRKLDKL
ncbi:MAG: polyhydroxyalkanoate synthesis repressor PhaR [Rhodobacteraceae bacterium]|nr:polyhydroxyalkanoate synthesis repressor PhaR [Paracoccaceae bacterium]